MKGSAIASDRDISLQAGNNVDIIAATESETHFLLEEKKKSGLLGSGGISFTLGSQSSRHQVDEKGTTQSLSVSTVGSSQVSTLTAGQSLSITAAGKNNIAGSGDIVVTGSTLTAGMDLKLDAGRDITLQSAQNIENTVWHNSSEGGHVGVGVGAGSGGYGISVSVGVN